MKADLLTRAVLHADETPVAMLKPGLGHTHKAYIWSYGSTQFEAAPLVVYDFTESRAGQHARDFLRSWNGKLVCDDFFGYKALFGRGVTEVGCAAQYPKSGFIRSRRMTNHELSRKPDQADRIKQ